MNSHVKWFEIPAANFDRAVKFYAELLDVRLNVCDSGDEAMAFFPEAERNAGGSISRAKDFTPSADGVLVYFDATGRMAALLRRVEACGGEVVAPQTVIGAEGRGSFALFKDTEGNRLGFHAD
jgi:predicted enzyme related to lactoylglutathione lyase